MTYIKETRIKFVKHSCFEYGYIYFLLARRKKEWMQTGKRIFRCQEMQLVLRTTSLLRKGNTASSVFVHERTQHSHDLGGWTSFHKHVT